MKYEDDLNCAVIAAEKHGELTLREVSERIGLSFVRVKQIEDTAKQKIKASLKDAYYL
jgi:DNA-directed RNA polymerase specialized sigma subunit